MATRRKRHGGRTDRGWEELNKSIGLTGLMETEALYVALRALPGVDAAQRALIDHYGSLATAQRSFEGLDDQVQRKFEVLGRELFGKEPSTEAT